MSSRRNVICWETLVSTVYNFSTGLFKFPFVFIHSNSLKSSLCLSVTVSRGTIIYSPSNVLFLAVNTLERDCPIHIIPVLAYDEFPDMGCAQLPTPCNFSEVPGLWYLHLNPPRQRYIFSGICSFSFLKALVL